MYVWGDVMSEIQRNEIIYEEGWRENAPVVDLEPEPLDEAEPQPQPAPREGSRPLLISIQLVLCLLAVLVLFLLKAMDSELYRDFMSEYREELDRPLISRGTFDTFDVSRLYEEQAVTVRATPDELSDR